MVHRNGEFPSKERERDRESSHGTLSITWGRCVWCVAWPHQSVGRPHRLSQNQDNSIQWKDDKSRMQKL